MGETVAAAPMAGKQSTEELVASLRAAGMEEEAAQLEKKISPPPAAVVHDAPPVREPVAAAITPTAPKKVDSAHEKVLKLVAQLREAGMFDQAEELLKANGMAP